MVLLGHALLVQALTFSMRPATTYRAMELGLPTSALGALSACFALAPLALAIPAGRLTDRVGESRTALAGGLCLLAGALVLLTAHDVVGLAMGTALLGMGHLGSVVAEQTWVANSTETFGADAAFGRYTFAASLGQAVGPASLGWVGGGLTHPETSPIFSAGVVLACAVMAASILIPRTAHRVRQHHDAAPSTRSLLRRQGLAQALFTSCMVLAAVDTTLAYVPALGIERGYTAGTVGMLLALRAVASMASRILLGRLVARLGRRRLLVVCTVAAGTGLAVAAVPSLLPVIAVAMFVAGFGLGVGQPLTMAWLASASPRGARGRAMSLRIVGNRAGQVIIPAAAGAFAAGAGASGVFAMSAVSLGLVGVSATRLPLDSSS